MVFATVERFDFNLLKNQRSFVQSDPKRADKPKSYFLNGRSIDVVVDGRASGFYKTNAGVP